ncbi:LOW QUALITY PROTEIN: hypothetical protein U9M48_018728, partial [Paspalum notatum var. saurae]
MLHLVFGPKWCNLIYLLLYFHKNSCEWRPWRKHFAPPGIVAGRSPLSPIFSILIMEVLNSLVNHATVNNIILKTNMTKSPIIPIQCIDDDLRIISESLPCEIKDILCTCLGLPLTIRKPTKSDWLPVIDKVADNIFGWKASPMSEVVHLVTVNVVSSAMLIYLLLAMDLPKWAIKAIDKLRREFLWKRQGKASGGNFLVAWEQIHQPLGLGCPNLRKWVGCYPLYGSGCKDRCFSPMGWVVYPRETIAEVAPNLIKLIPKQTVKQCAAAQALNNHSCVRIKGALI